MSAFQETGKHALCTHAHCVQQPLATPPPHSSRSPLTRKFLGVPSLDLGPPYHGVPPAEAPGLCGEVKQGIPFYFRASVAWCYRDIWPCPPESAAPNHRNSRAALPLSREGLFLHNLTAQLSTWISLAFGGHVRLILTSTKNFLHFLQLYPPTTHKNSRTSLCCILELGQGLLLFFCPKKGSLTPYIFSLLFLNYISLLERTTFTHSTILSPKNSDFLKSE